MPPAPPLPRPILWKENRIRLNQLKKTEKPVREPSLPGIYVHIPFCRKKCPYCSFYSVSAPFDASIFNRSLKKQADWFAAQKETAGFVYGSIFFGGGTPTILPSSELSALLAFLLVKFSFTDSPEISIEANPATVSGEDLQLLRSSGFNRLSLGVQSLNDTELACIGRIHKAIDAEDAFFLGREAGFDNISMDLMFGLPGQTLTSWRNTLEKALAMEPDHLSVYELTIEEGTEFGRLATMGELELPTEDTVLAMMDLLYRCTHLAGMKRYEISNYAKPGFRCRHNLNYWHNGDYLGLGPGAVSCIAERRLHAWEDLEKWTGQIDADQPFWDEEECLGDEARFRETVVLGLRMLQGVSIASLQKRFSMDPLTYFEEQIASLKAQGLVDVADDTLWLTEAGLRVANTVMCEFV